MGFPENDTICNDRYSLSWALGAYSSHLEPPARNKETYLGKQAAVLKVKVHS